MPPEAWYEMYCDVKPWHPALAMVGILVLSQVISASSCERNWSAHGHIQTNIRNKLNPETTEKLVFVYSNNKMQARRHRGQLPPFCKLVGKHKDVFRGRGLGGSHSDAMAGCPVLPATSSPPRPCPPVAERPADGLHRWRLPALHFRWLSRAAPRRRGSARAVP